MDNKKYAMLWKVYGCAGLLVTALCSQLVSYGVLDSFSGLAYRIFDFGVTFAIFLLFYLAVIYGIKHLQLTDSEIYKKRIFFLKAVAYISPPLFVYTAIMKFIS